jgi:hypothetical protein
LAEILVQSIRNQDNTLAALEGRLVAIVVGQGDSILRRVDVLQATLQRESADLGGQVSQTVGSRIDAVIRAIGGAQQVVLRAIGGAQQVILLDNADTREGVGYAISAIGLDVELLGRAMLDSEERLVGEMVAVGDQVIVETNSLDERIGGGLLTLGYAVAAASYDVEGLGHRVQAFERQMASWTYDDTKVILEAITRTANGVDALRDEVAGQTDTTSTAVESLQAQLTERVDTIERHQHHGNADIR